jgi:NifB/MoaA-like Fe-S oxidoreductase
MIRSFLNSFESLLKKLEKRNTLAVSGQSRTDGSFAAANVRTHQLAIKPKMPVHQSQLINHDLLNGTILTGEMFAPILREQIEKLNVLIGAGLHVLAVPNTYFGGDVAVAGLLTGQDYLAVKDQIKGDFVIIPKHTIKSDEPILLDGMQFEDLKQQFPLPVYEMDTEDFVRYLQNAANGKSLF